MSAMNANESQFLIWSIEHTAWWRPGRLGYTERVAEAGHYSAAEAKRIVARANIRAFHECMIPLGAVTHAPTSLTALNLLADLDLWLADAYAWRDQLVATLGEVAR